ncbi:hypothetical protein [Chitinophaga niabensis]|uniref:Uncharacterized protein n=1 Tax=Chitinophaga niabensis TaxID=536979 RepID=A0A1N6KAL2_9BACT|nr:hypothetical protein [Chitinophaga niabensis]SIO53503.1 hypothetical protein SAMN04488055_5427 [Chitinophaga niabensis]
MISREYQLKKGLQALGFDYDKLSKTPFLSGIDVLIYKDKCKVFSPDKIPHLLQTTIWIYDKGEENPYIIDNLSISINKIEKGCDPSNSEILSECFFSSIDALPKRSEIIKKAEEVLHIRSIGEKFNIDRLKRVESLGISNYKKL